MESVYNQTSIDFEYIVVDGGSTDGSKEIILEFSRKDTDKFKKQKFVWLSEPDDGIYHAMNKGIQIAKGEYCQFLNSGDCLVNSDATFSMLEDLPDSNIVYGNMLKQMPDGKILVNKELPTGSFLPFYIGSFNQPSSYIRRSLFEKYGLFDESLKIVSDWKFGLITIVLNNEKASYRNINLTCFNMNGISNTNKELDHLERRKVLEQLIPSNILADYDNYARLILQMKRINRFKFTKWIVWLIERILFKIEKWETRKKGEHILY